MNKKEKQITTSELNIISSLLTNFCMEYVNEVRQIIKKIEKINSKNVRGKLPSPFNKDTAILIEVAYSIDQTLILIKFSRIKGENNRCVFIPIEGSPIPGNIFGFDNPQEFTGIMNLTNVTIGSFFIEYGFLTSLKGLSNKVTDIRTFASDFINSYIDLSKYKKQNDKVGYSIYLKEVKEEFLKLISDEKTPELTIDKFLENHPVILQRGLHLDKFMHQVIMKNLLGKYEHDLKPDLIAYDVLNNKWVVVDYKRAKNSLIKNIGKVRTGFKSEVNDLENQLFDYLEYFGEKEHRDYIEKEYKCNIKYPEGIGVIGNIKSEEQDEFNRLMQNKPRWFNIMPYNYLYDSFCRYIELVDDIAKKMR